MTAGQEPVGLYLHIPFCARVCHFCAFVTRGHREDRAAAFVEDLLAEIQLYGKDALRNERPVETVYVGGGTPTTLSSRQLQDILEACRRAFPVAPSAEVTIEANPATVSEAALGELRQAGCTRISFGAQSFFAPELQRLGTPHHAEEIPTAVQAARRAGFTNCNLDMIYGLPGQTLARWRTNLQAALALAPEHLACYGLTVEEGTRFHGELGRGRLDVPDEDLMVRMYQAGTALLEGAGYAQYEVSNFARPGYACRHNVGYWSDREWLGLGPGAHSYWRGERYANVESLEHYHQRLSENLMPVAEREPADPDRRLREALALGLRTTHGVPLPRLQARYGVAVLDRFQEPIVRLVGAGLLVQEDEWLRPTCRGLLFADELALAFL